MDSSATDTDDDDLPSDIYTTVVGYERPFCPYISTSDARFIERSNYRRNQTRDDLPFITVTDCDGSTVYASGCIATVGPTDGPCTSTTPIGSVLKRDAGTMPRYAYWDTPANDRAYGEEEEMTDLYRRVLSDVDPFAAECIYLTDDEIREALQWDKLDVMDDMKQQLFDLCKKFRDIFASAGNSGKLDTVQHLIDTDHLPRSNRGLIAYPQRNAQSSATQ